MLKLEGLGKRIKEAREEKGLTQEALAQKLTYNLKRVNHWETGYNTPPVPQILALCEALDVTPSWLFGYKETEIQKRIIEDASYFLGFAEAILSQGQDLYWTSMISRDQSLLKIIDGKWEAFKNFLDKTEPLSVKDLGPYAQKYDETLVKLVMMLTHYMNNRGFLISRGKYCQRASRAAKRIADRTKDPNDRWCYLVLIIDGCCWNLISLATNENLAEAEALLKSSCASAVEYGFADLAALSLAYLSRVYRFQGHLNQARETLSKLEPVTAATPLRKQMVEYRVNMQKAEQFFEEGCIGENATTSHDTLKKNKEALIEAQSLYERLVKYPPDIERPYSVRHRLSRTYVELARLSKGKERSRYLHLAEITLKEIRDEDEKTTTRSSQADFAEALIAELRGQRQEALRIAMAAIPLLPPEARGYYVVKDFNTLIARCNR